MEDGDGVDDVDVSCQALVDEDRLLSRLECLEEQLAVFSKVNSIDSFVSVSVVDSSC